MSRMSNVLSGGRARSQSRSRSQSRAKSTPRERGGERVHGGGGSGSGSGGGRPVSRGPTREGLEALSRPTLASRGKERLTAADSAARAAPVRHRIKVRGSPPCQRPILRILSVFGRLRSVAASDAANV
jgi:hypothetical protein